jgi:hypothetical protein
MLVHPTSSKTRGAASEHRRAPSRSVTRLPLVHALHTRGRVLALRVALRGRAAGATRARRGALILALVATSRAAAAACTVVPLLQAGNVVDGVCAESPGPGRVVVDLGDEWAPRLFAETSERPLSYRSTFVALANERFEPGPGGDGARRDRYFELFGIFPSISVIRARLLDGERHACHERVSDGALRAQTRTLTPWDPTP